MEIENLTEKARYDYKLVQDALHKKDQKAYAELMHRYRDTVFFMLLKMVNNKDDAEDLTIEAFGKAFKRLDQYTPNFAFSTWLFKIASNNCIDFIRKKKAHIISLDRSFQNDEGGELKFEIKAEQLDPEEKLLKKEKVQNLRVVVEKLKPKYKLLVELRYYEELSYEEIAEKLNLPLGTVKAQLFRAREFLSQILQNQQGL